ncbi:hypothetical protein GCM10022240_28990 [Microbacterium kribbense]|uniref:Tfp pilus assembly protein PilN n=1 Tax=Microbacterium kribbense TaxID=433645 RepID=A0ABP7GVM1_9MICO
MTLLPVFGKAAPDRVPRVNLLPRRETERRDRAALTRRWMLALVAALLVVVLVSAGGFVMKMMAAQRLAAQNAHTTQLVGQLASLSDVSKIRAVQKDLEGYRTEAMGTDIAWQPVYGLIAQRLPAGADITAWDLAAGALPGKEEATAQAGITGTMTLTSPTPVDIVATVRALRDAPGVLHTDGTELTRDAAATDSGKATYTYSITLTLDQTVYTGAYAAQKQEK